MTFDNFPPSRRDALRDDAVRLRAILRGVRGARSDERDFALFDARDELKGLGVDAAQIDAFDAHDDAALDHHIGQAHAVATALGALDEADHSALWGEGGVETLAGENGNDTLLGGGMDDRIEETAAKAPHPPTLNERVMGSAPMQHITRPFKIANRLAHEEAARAKEEARRAGVFNSRGLPDSSNNQFDAERHARWAYRTAKEVGPRWATIFGVGHELDNLVHGGPVRETVMDLHNNGVGIGQARAGRRRAEPADARTAVVWRQHWTALKRSVAEHGGR